MPYILRITFGPLHYSLVIGLYYSYRVTLTFTITVLTGRTLLMSAFLKNFNEMSGALIM